MLMDQGPLDHVARQAGAPRANNGSEVVGSGFGRAIARQYGASRSLTRALKPALVAWVDAAQGTWLESRELLPRDALLLTIDLQPGGWRQQADSWRGVAQRHSIHLHGLQEPLRLRVRGRFEILAMLIDRTALGEFEDDGASCRLDAIARHPGTIDPIIGALGATIAIALQEPEAATTRYLDHLALATIGKVVAAYSGVDSAPPAHRGGLAPWQERRAKELLADCIATDLSMTEIARECRLSRGHFGKAFKRTTGQSPHAWLTQHRVETAQAFLRRTDQSLAEIALACGFWDQSHLTRVFHKVTGASPGQWRRMLPT